MLLSSTKRMIGEVRDIIENQQIHYCSSVKESMVENLRIWTILFLI